MTHLQNFSVITNYTMWSYNLFFASSCFPRFSWARFFRVQVFQDPGFSGSGSKVQVWVRVLEVANANQLIQITLVHECSPVNLLHVFRTVSHKIISLLLLNIITNKRGKAERKIQCNRNYVFIIWHIYLFSVLLLLKNTKV